MVVNDFKGEPPAAAASYSRRTIASSQSGHRQTVPSEAEELHGGVAAHELQDLPPPYEASIHNHDSSTTAVAAVSSDTASIASSAHDDESAAMVRPTTRRNGPSGKDHAAQSPEPGAGYQRTAKMTWEEKDASGYWDKHDSETGICCSRRGACCFSDRGACCFSDREACCFSDRDACCFSDRDACCFSDNGACCFSDNGACCFSGTAPGGRWKPVPSFGTLFKGLC